MGYYGRRWRPYVSVATRRARAARKVAALRKKGREILPVEIEGRKIARTFWGQAWCNHLEAFSDFANRLPRGRTYVRNGSVCHLAISKGSIRAIVSGSDLYNVSVKIAPLARKKWQSVSKRCAGQIGSMLELLQGKLSASVMEVVTGQQDGLFPLPGEITFTCDCPDWADMCKHVAAVLYGVGARLDEQPELLFLLRGVDHEELITAPAVTGAVIKRGGRRKKIAAKDLSGVFDIDIVAEKPAKVKTKTAKKKTAKKKTAKKKTAKKKTAKKKTAVKKKATTRKKKTAKKTMRKRVRKPARTTPR